ncbi:MAG TPA: heme-binding protein [Planctomycetaceae bacterium]|nr:heme-binding protein [Planctomycetaceae bacterium]
MIRFTKPWQPISARNSSRRRSAPEGLLSQIEHLTPRLCLGSVSGGAADDDWSGGTGEQPVPVEVGSGFLDPWDDLPDAMLRHLNEAPMPVIGDAAMDPPQSAPPPEVLAGSSSLLLDAQLISTSLSADAGDAADAIGGGTDSDGFGATIALTANVAGDDGTGAAATLAVLSAPAGLSAPASTSDSGISSEQIAGMSHLDANLLIGAAPSEAVLAMGETPWWTEADGPVVIQYDFRDVNGFENLITEDQRARAVDAMQAWSDATGGKLVFVHDTQADFDQIVNIGTGDLAALDYVSSAGSALGLGGGVVTVSDTATSGASQSVSPSHPEYTVTGVAWLDMAETWDTEIGNGNPEGTRDYFTVVAHEIGHVLGLDDSWMPTAGNIMYAVYNVERSANSISEGIRTARFYTEVQPAGNESYEFVVHPMIDPAAQLTAAEVEQLLSRAAGATASEDAIIAVVDRNGRILGVRVEQDVLDTFAGRQDELVFAIDGAVAKARTAAFFANGDPTNVDAFSPGGTLGPLTSRTVRFISQSTVTQREVESNPNMDSASEAEARASTVYGPGFVAPIGIGGHFPPDIMFTPPVDLFAIEHTNRDSILHAGPDGVRGTADDIILPTIVEGPTTELRNRFNLDLAFVPAGQSLFAPESYGHANNSGLLETAQARGIATLPGGIPLYRDTNGDGVGESLIGGIGVFFPGPDGFATFEQNFIPGIGQTTFQRTNAPKVLEAEYIAYAATGGSVLAAVQFGVKGAVIDDVAGIPRVAGLDLPFGRIDLVGIQLELIGPCPGELGLAFVLQFGNQLGEGDPNSGADQPLTAVMAGDDGFHRGGLGVPEGFLVTPHDSLVDPELTAARVQQIIEDGIAAAQEVRAAIRLPLSSRTRMVFAVADKSGEILGLFRMPDATVFSIDVAVAKARNTAYYADAATLQAADQVPGVPAGTAFTNRTFRFLAEPRFPSGVDFSPPPEFSILNHPAINNRTAENIGAPAPAGTFDQQTNPDTGSALGYDAFFVDQNFHDPDAAVPAGVPNNETANQNGVVWFPGSTPLYVNGRLVGGFGVSGDGVDQDDVVTFLGAREFLPPNTVLRADQVRVDGVRLPYIKFLRNPFG